MDHPLTRVKDLESGCYSRSALSFKYPFPLQTLFPPAIPLSKPSGRGKKLWTVTTLKAFFNVSRGKRQKEDQDGLIPSILEPGGSSKARPGATWLRI